MELGDGEMKSISFRGRIEASLWGGDLRHLRVAGARISVGARRVAAAWK
jgi:hypothetical protein